MARINNLNNFNTERQKAIKIKTAVDESIVLEKEELRDVLKLMVTDELDWVAQKSITSRKIELETRINFKLKQLENSLVNLINTRVDKITERIVELTINRIVEEEVAKRFELKLKYKDDNEHKI